MNIINKPLYDFFLLDIIKIIIRNKKILLVLIGLSTFISIIISMLLPVYYMSTAIIYPNNLTISDRTSIFSQEGNKSEEHSYFGNKYDANRLLTMANSNQIFDYIYDKYKLNEYYGFDQDEQFLKTKVKEKFKKNYSAYKNDRDAIELQLYDRDNQNCAKILNDIIGQIDKMSLEPIKESKVKVLQKLEAEIISQRSLYDSMSKSGANPSEIDNVNKNLTLLNNAHTQYRVSSNVEISSLTILQKAEYAEKKSKPVRSRIVLLTLIVSTIASIMGVILIDQYRYLKTNIH